MLRYRYTLVLFTVLLGLQNSSVLAYSGNSAIWPTSYDGYISTCSDCHTGNNANFAAATGPFFTGSTTPTPSSSTAYSIKISGSPVTNNNDGVAPSETTNNGFALSVRDGSGTRIGTYTGSGAEKSDHVPDTVVTHNTPQAANFTFAFNWIPPSTYTGDSGAVNVGNYTMYGCVNQANGDTFDGGFDGPPKCGSQTIKLNRTPDANNDNKTVDEDSVSNNFTSTSLLSNDYTGTSSTKVEMGDSISIDTSYTLSPSSGSAIYSGSNILYTPVAHDDTSATLNYRIKDSEGLTNVATISIAITAINDTPVISIDNSSAPTYEEGDSPVTLDSTISITDVETGDQINQARVVIGSYQSGQDFLACTGSPTGIASCNFSAGTLTLSGTTSRANYANALETVTYENTSLNPTTGDRIVTFDVTDNSGDATTNTSATDSVTVTVSAVSTPPLFTGFVATSDTGKFVEGTPEPVNGAITITDPDSLVLNRATMKLTTNYLSSEDLLVCPGSLPAGITCSYDTGTLILSSATTNSYADYSTAIQAINYNNISENPDETARTVTLTIRDDSTTVSTPVNSKLISVTRVNDAPVITSTATPVTATEEVTYSYTPTVSDPDDAAAGISFTISSEPAGSTFDTSTGAFSWSPPRTNTFTDAIATFRIEVEDGDEEISAPNFEDISLIVSPLDTDLDGVADYSDNCPTVANGPLAADDPGDNQGDNDNDTVHTLPPDASGIPADGDVDPTDTLTGGDACDTDDDNDGISDVDELLYPTCLDKDNAADATEDCDADGLDNITEINDGNPDTVPDVDSVGPTVNAPTDITIDATGLLTIVNLGTATGIDGNDGEVTIIKAAVDLDAGQIAALEAQITGCELLATYETDIEPFAPGMHVVTWASCDSKGNSGHDEQTVNVKPLVSVSAGQSVGEGRSVSLDVVLNGEAIDYPASVQYSLTGTATEVDDHDGSAGLVTFSGLGDVGIISFNTVADGITEGNETVLVTLFAPVNIALGNTRMHTITITEDNIAPQVELVATQGANVIGNTIYKLDGTATIVASANDGNGDTLSFDWSATNPVLLAASTVSANRIDIDASDVSLISGDFYKVSVTVSDGNLPVTIERLLLVKAAEAVVLSAVDSDGDGFNDDDASEGFADDDADGIPNYLDNRFVPVNVIGSHSVTLESSALVETNPGLRIVKGETAVAALVDGIVIGMQDLIAHGGPGGTSVSNADTDHTFLSSLINFEVHGLTDAIESVHVVVPLSSSLQAGTVFRKYNSSGWFDFVIDDKNAIASAAGEDGACPQPGSSRYSVGLTAGHLCVQLTIQDGGANDADGVRNFIVKDPGGLALAPEPEEVASSSDSGRVGSVSLWFMLLLSITAVAVWHLRMRKLVRIKNRHEINR